MRKLSDEERVTLQKKIARERVERSGQTLAHSKPPLSVGRVIAEFVASGLGILAGLIVFWILELIIGFPDWAKFLLILIILLPSGATPVYLVGTTGNETGSYLATLAGSLFAPIGGVIGFNITRRYKTPKELNRET